MSQSPLIFALIILVALVDIALFLYASKLSLWEGSQEGEEEA